MSYASVKAAVWLCRAKEYKTVDSCSQERPPANVWRDNGDEAEQMKVCWWTESNWFLHILMETEDVE